MSDLFEQAMTKHVSLAETHPRWSQALVAPGSSSDFAPFHQFVEDRAGER